MHSLSRRLAAALAILCALASPALADTTVYNLTYAAGWTKIASAGSSVFVFDGAGSVVLSTATSGGAAPTANTGIGLVQTQGQCLTLTADLYAMSQVGIVNVISGVTCPGGSSGGGSSSSTISGPLGPSTLAANSVATVLASGATLPLPTGASTSALQTQTDTDLKATQPRVVQATPVAITQTETAVPAATSTAITALTSRKFLSMTNDGTNPCRVSYGVAATASNGEPLGAAASANGQGGARTFDSSAVPQVTVYAYCASASSFAVLEGQ